jgi:hypothetical protein
VSTETHIKSEALAAVTAYLDGSRSGPDVAAWAMSVLIPRSFDDEPLLQEVLEALWNLDHEDERWDTSRNDLENLRDCLLGKKEFIPPVVTETHA